LHLRVEGIEVGAYVAASGPRLVAIADVEHSMCIDAEKRASVLDVQL
jgi:hypothetical protein